MKTCTKCHITYPESAFNRSSRNKSGLRAECRQCQSDASKGYSGPARQKGQSRTKYLKMRVDGVNVMVHRHTMEQIIGRKLSSSETVHHIDGNKHNNHPDNLMLMDRSEHCRITNLGAVETPEQRAKISASLIGNQRRKGIPHSPEIKAKIGQKIKEARQNKFWSTKKRTD